MSEIFFQYYFHAVGQGLFAAGHIWDESNKRQFNWIFDCGTNSSIAFLERELGKFRMGMNGKPIQVFCLSHFDRDHVNGATQLLSSHRVDTLVMPYFPFVERVQIALGTRDLTDDYLSFLIDPAGYMYAAGGDNLGEVIFITGDTSLSSENENEPPSRAPDDDWTFRPPPDMKEPNPPANEDIHGISDENTWKAVRVYSHRKPFAVGNFWEFMFFNEHIPSDTATTLLSVVVDVVTRHRRPDGSFDGVGLIREIKPLYIREFGGSGYDKNKISLITYSGPMRSLNLRAAGLLGRVIPANLSEIHFPAWVQFLLAPKESQVSITYFGDYPLTDHSRLINIQSHFGRARWERIEIIQVPHHGSKHSWHDNASAVFHNHASVISSARNSKHHPAPSVLSDLSTHGIVLVHELQSASFNGGLRYH